jgi:hypothetical protein
MSINWEIKDKLILLNVSGTQLDIMIETLKPIMKVIDESVEKTKNLNPKFNLAIDRVYINADVHVFKHVIDFLCDQLVVPSNLDDRLRLRKLADSYGLYYLVKLIEIGKYQQQSFKDK